MKIRIGTITEAFQVAQGIVEFEQQYPLEKYEERLLDVKHLILIAEMEIEIEERVERVGYKVGYDRYKDGSFYSWVGGVLPEFRRKGVALALADEQEVWAKQEGFHSIKFKTRNRYTNMLHFGINNGFHIIGVEEKEDSLENRILLEKVLK